MPLFILIVGVGISLVLSFFLIPIAIKAAQKYNLLDLPGQHKRHKHPTPYVGGVVLFIVCWLTIGICWLLFPSMFSEISQSIFYIFLGSLIIVMVGFSDDISPVSAWIKLLAQIGAGLLLYFGGLHVELIGTPFGVLDISGYSVIVTVFWVVALTNAINLIDGLDGLAPGVSLIAAITLLVIGQFYSVGATQLFMLVLIGFLILFLYYNWYPAKIFLGDSGSMQIGFYFAVFSLIFPLKSFATIALYVPLLALGVPLLEMLTSIIRRLLSGKNIMTADRRHLFHYLSIAGLSPGMVLTVFYLLAIVFGLFSVAMFFWDRVLVFGFLVIFMVVILAVFFILIFKFVSPKSLKGQKREKGI